MAVDYKKIGLVNTKDMFARAINFISLFVSSPAGLG